MGAAALSVQYLAVQHLAVRRGGRRVFDSLSFELGAGELLALTGGNGSGKTTLLRTLALLVPRDSGDILWQGASVEADREAWRGRIAWLGHSDGLKGDLTIAENLAAADALRHGRPPASGRIEQALAAFDLASLADRPARALSAGQRRRAGLARVASSGADIWLLDEPLNALDVRGQESLRAALQAHLARGRLVVAATHAALDIAGARALDLGT